VTVGVWFRILNLSSAVSSEKTTIGSRLREERQRLALNQTDFASLGGCSKHSQIDWEANTASPNAKYLSAVAAAGADVLYIVTGERKSASPAAFQPAKLRRVVEEFEEALQQKRRPRITPAKKAQLIALAYDHFPGPEKVERAAVDEFLRLLA